MLNRLTASHRTSVVLEVLPLLEVEAATRLAGDDRCQTMMTYEQQSLDSSLRCVTRHRAFFTPTP